eukprot:TRINITY_DN41425_c0_g1_i1.p2 TRINITY_DN41425_c0_g1~~TRINITY_DN41425_c0_g1_i1.p2  ORF type:complete len:146 (-),score=8.93 TRINITY_DN41425_c0_g1_i1:122-559(-)
MREEIEHKKRKYFEPGQKMQRNHIEKVGRKQQSGEKSRQEMVRQNQSVRRYNGETNEKGNSSKVEKRLRKRITIKELTGIDRQKQLSNNHTNHQKLGLYENRNSKRVDEKTEIKRVEIKLESKSSRSEKISGKEKKKKKKKKNTA